MYDYRITLLVVGIVLTLKLVFWALYFLYRRRQQQRMVQAGLIRPAVPNVWASPTVDMAAQANYNTQYWSVTPSSAAPPPYEAVAKKQELAAPPSYQETVGAY